ncbi:EpsG family protein [Adlercreutzia sp. ZJ473]|uniref:EpsG family protein n=1 Tax=Adlercreutzia sp. ZJ473 TaxID=2722822 RepID=UPI001554F55D|nr:EpsG family protein [Adlercreutzia sp. ZJ473]
MAPYAVLLLFILVLGLIAREAAFVGKRLSKHVTAVGCFAIALMAALRSPTVGADTSNYQNYFSWIAGIPLTDIASTDTAYWNSQGTEITYKLFNKFVSMFSVDPQAITIACAIVLGVGLYCLCCQSKDSWLSLLLFVCFGLFQTAMNIAPSCLASIIATVGLRYIPQRNPKMFFLCIALGLIFHYASLMFIPLYFLGRIGYRLKGVVIILIVAFAAIPVLYTSIVPLIALVVPSRWAQYLQVERVSLSQLGVWTFYAGMFMLAVLFSNSRDDDRSERINLANMLFLVVGIAYAFTLCSMSFSRIAILFAPYLVVAIPEYLADAKESMRNSRITRRTMTYLDWTVHASHAKTVTVSVATAVFVLRLAINNIGLTIPYEFFFLGDKMKRYLLIIKLMLMRDGYKRAEYLRKRKYFHRQGENCFFQPFNFGTEPHLISMGSNVYFAAGVRFLTHDVIALMLRTKLGREDINERVGSIEIGNNVFVGADTTLLYDIKIGSNVIVAAGSLVSKDIPDNSVCAGRPARIIGTFVDYEKRMLEYSELMPWKQWEQRRDQIVHIEREYFWSGKRKKPFSSKTNNK